MRNLDSWSFRITAKRRAEKKSQEEKRKDRKKDQNSFQETSLESTEKKMKDQRRKDLNRTKKEIKEKKRDQKRNDEKSEEREKKKSKDQESKNSTFCPRWRECLVTVGIGSLFFEGSLARTAFLRDSWSPKCCFFPYTMRLRSVTRKLRQTGSGLTGS